MAATPEDMREHCECCANELELGQIGKCDSCQQSAEPEMFTNHYLCNCGAVWQGTWSAMCNDKCPKCNKETQPFISDDGSLSSEDITSAQSATATRLGIPG